MENQFQNVHFADLSPQHKKEFIDAFVEKSNSLEKSESKATFVSQNDPRYNYDDESAKYKVL